MRFGSEESIRLFFESLPVDHKRQDYEFLVPVIQKVTPIVAKQSLSKGWLKDIVLSEVKARYSSNRPLAELEDEIITAAIVDLFCMCAQKRKVKGSYFEPKYKR
jgi:hypothetical protein